MKGAFVRKLLASAAVAVLGAASLSGVAIVPDAQKVEPLALPTDEPALLAAQRKLAGVAGRPDDSVPVLIKLSAGDADLPRKVRNLAGVATMITPRHFTALIPRDAARYISNWPEVSYIEAGKLARPLLDLSRTAVSADVVQAGTGLPPPFDAGIRGQGVYVGIVDTGLSGTHPDFRNPSPPFPRVVHTYASPQLPILGLSPDPFVDEDGHGTHVSGIAAGNGSASGGLYTGMAPGAGSVLGGILVGKTSFYTTDVINALSDFAGFAGNRPLSVNLSLGLMVGPHDGTSVFEDVINDLATGPAGSKRIIAVAAGNEVGRNEHFQQAALPLFGTVTATAAFANVASASMEFWADGGDRFTVTATMGTDTVTVPSGASASSPQGRIHVSNPGTPSPLNGGNLISLSFQPLIGSSATIRFDRTRNGGSGRVDGYIEHSEGSFTSGMTNAGTITEPANGDNVVTVGSFNTKSYPAGTPTVQSISSFSSRGPTRDGRTKPDIAAPGSVIYSARSFDAPAGSYSLGLVPGNDNYAILQGTSMATPHVTGIAALVWESNPALTGAQVRQRIKRTADPPTDGSTPPNNTWGYGKVNAMRAVSRTVASITAPATAIPGAAVALSSADSSGAYDQSTFVYNLSYGWSLAAKPPGSGATLASNAPSTTFTPDVPGDYIVSLTVSQSAPSGVPAGTDNAAVHVNHIPVAAIAGPAFTDNVVPVRFTGSAADPDVAAFGQTINWRWVLVSRPAGSAATLSQIAGTENATLLPDVRGTYEIGLRADDVLDNSALAVVAFQSGITPVFTSGGGGGGCSVARTDAADSGANAGTALFLLAALARLLALRRRMRQAQI